MRVGESRVSPEKVGSISCQSDSSSKEGKDKFISQCQFKIICKGSRKRKNKNKTHELETGS
jgi:hypothetical protein